MKVYYKSVGRMFKKNFSRFVSIIFIVAISISLASGVGSSSGKIDNSLENFKRTQNVSDVTIKNKSQTGFDKSQISALRQEYGEENVATGSSFDVYIDHNGERRLTRLVFLDNFGDFTVNKFSYVNDGTDSGAAIPEGSHVAYAEKADNVIKGYDLGEEISLDFNDIFTQLAEQGGRELSDFQKKLFASLRSVAVTVTRTVENPLYFARDGEPSYLNGDVEIPDTINFGGLISLDDVLYLSSDVIPLATATSDIYISFANKTKLKFYTSEYASFAENEKENILDNLSYASGEDISVVEENTAFITLEDNYSFKSVSSYAKKITALAIVLMAAFMFITALVVLSNMTRLMDEERAQSACLSTLGYSFGKIVGKYLLFAFTATAIGGAAAYFIGTGLCSFIYLTFGYSYAMPPESSVFGITFYVITLVFIVVSAILATLRAGIKNANETPAELLKPKSPVPGRKVFLEKIPFIWNKLSFKYKSTARNVLRYRNRFIMTVAAVAGSMGLVMAGLALLDMCLFQDFGNASIAWLAVVVVVFAALLTFTAIYTITDISVSERNREIATLMVLGYYDYEVTGYIYREIYVDASVGLVFGYGAGAILMSVIFAVMGFGSLGGVSWYVWLLSPVLVLFFTFAVTLMLRKRIVSTDMNASLKTVE